MSRETLLESYKFKCIIIKVLASLYVQIVFFFPSQCTLLVLFCFFLIFVRLSYKEFDLPRSKI